MTQEPDTEQLRGIPRIVKYIVIHCSAPHIGDDPAMFACHFYLPRDGSIKQPLDLETIGRHTKGFNNQSIGICYEGGADEDGLPSDTRTAEQRRALKTLVRTLKESYPDAVVVGHNQLMVYTGVNVCPAFDVGSDGFDC